MIRRLVHLQLVGPRDDLIPTVESLQRFGYAEVVPGSYPGAGPVAGPRTASATAGGEHADRLNRMQRLLDLPLSPPITVPTGAGVNTGDHAGGHAEGDGEAQARATGTPRILDLSTADRVDIDLLEVEVETLRATRTALEDERDGLQHYLAVLRQLEDLVPELAALSDHELETLGLGMAALVLDDPAGAVVDLLDGQLYGLLGRSYLLATTETGRTRGCLLVVPRDHIGEVERLVSADQIGQVSIPKDYAHLSLHMTVVRMAQQLTAVRGQLEVVIEDLAGLGHRIRPALEAAVRAERVLHERDTAIEFAQTTARSFLLRCWVPASHRELLRHHLTDDGLPGVAIIEAPPEERPGPPPVELEGRAAWAPYRRLVGFLSWPSPSGVDPSGMMAIALPFLFGVMVGDVVYGAALLGIGWLLRRRATRTAGAGGVLDDAGRILMAGGAWAVVWGVLFGEALGSLGNTLGMPALWFYRGGPAALEPLLLFAVALGWTHIVLGLTLGVVTSLRRGDRHRLMEMGGTLTVLLGLTGAVAALIVQAPTWLTLFGAAVAVTGLFVTSAAHGPLGALLGPLELIGTVGNILSYLRVAAVGLASVYLANVANELATELPLLAGLLVATFLHLLNLALAAFSPMVQALRLHYVEFFSKFHDGEGQAFRPLGAHGAPACVVIQPADAPSSGIPHRVPSLDANHER